MIPPSAFPVKFRSSIACLHTRTQQKKKHQSGNSMCFLEQEMEIKDMSDRERMFTFMHLMHLLIGQADYLSSFSVFHIFYFVML